MNWKIVMKQQYSDEELVAKYKESRNPQFLTELFTRHSGVLYRRALHTSKNPSNAEDVLQTAFIKMITDLPNYKGTGSVIGWMLQVVIHTSYERFRSEKSRQNRERKVMSERIQTTKHINDELKEMIEAHLNKLPEIYKVPITLKIMEGLSIKEVSDALEIPEKTIRSQIDRGLEKLKASLQSVGITASVISIGDMLQSIQKPLTPEVFTNSQYFTSLFKKKIGLSTNLSNSTGAKSTGFQFVVAFLVLMVAIVSAIYVWPQIWKTSSPVSRTKAKTKQEWNFEKTNNLEDYLTLGLLSGSISIAESLGVDQSNALKIEESSIVEIDISGFDLPIKVSYKTDNHVEKLSNEQGFMQMILKGNYRNDKKILKISGVREHFNIADSNRNSNAKLGYFGIWYSFEGFIDENSVDFFMEGKRSYYLEGTSQDNKKLFLTLKANTIIDNLKIESIDESALPDKDKVEKVCASTNYLKDVEYYNIQKEKLDIPEKSNVKPYLRVIRSDFFSHMAGTDGEVIFPILNSKNIVEWKNNKKRASKKWDFDNDQDLETFQLIKGRFFDGKSLGLNQSNCLGFEADSVVEIDISKFNLPLKITYSFDYVIPGGVAGGKSSKGFSVLKGNYQKDRNILDFIKFKPTRTINIPDKNKNENTKLGFVGEWVTYTIYVSDDGLDFYFNGNRTAIKLGKSIDNKKIYLVLLDKFLVDFFTVESIEPDSVPDISKFKKFAESFPFEKGSRGYFELEKETPPLNLEKNSLVKLGVFDSDTIELLLGFNQSLKTNVPSPDSFESNDHR